ncbi:MAG: phosphotransferase family protein [Hyphomonadaceae bacterium]
MSIADLSAERRAWIEHTVAAQVTQARRLFGGGSRETYLVDAQQSDAAFPLVLRAESGAGAHAGTSFSLAREYEVYSALAHTDVPTPHAYGLSANGDALLLQRLEGTGDFHKLPADQQASVAADFMRALAALHALDTDELPLPSFARPRDAQDNARLDLARWRDLSQTRTAHDDAFMHYAYAWFDAFAPANVEHTRLVQGDTGPGNFMSAQGAVTGLIDWEFSHLGDPMTDFGWLRLRCRKPAHYALFEAAFADYERGCGQRIDPRRVDYHFALALLRCIVTVAMARRTGGALGAIQYRIAEIGYLDRMARALLHLTGLKSDAAIFAPAPSALAAEALQELDAHIAPALSDHRGRLAAHAIRATLRHFAARDAIGARINEEDRADRSRVFGGDLAGAALCAAAAEGGRAGDCDQLQYFARRAAREASLWP